MEFLHPKVRDGLLGVATLLAVVSWLPHPIARAADQVVLKYSVLRESVSVADLTAFAERNEISTALQAQLTTSRQDPEEVRRVLTREVKADPLLLDRVLNGFAGETILDQLGQVIHTPSGGADRQALRSALVLSATPDGKVTLLEVIQNYPTQEVHVEGDRLVQAYARLEGFSQQLRDIADILKQVL